MLYRKLSSKEILFIERLLKGKPGWKKYILQLRAANVIDLNVKYCLKFLLQEYNYKDVEIFGSNLVQKQIIDKDNVPVLISLDLDRNGNLFELDVWKADFSEISIDIFEKAMTATNGSS